MHTRVLENCSAGTFKVFKLHDVACIKLHFPSDPVLLPMQPAKCSRLPTLGPMSQRPTIVQECALPLARAQASVSTTKLHCPHAFQHNTAAAFHQPRRIVEFAPLLGHLAALYFNDGSAMGRSGRLSSNWSPEFIAARMGLQEL